MADRMDQKALGAHKPQDLEPRDAESGDMESLVSPEPQLFDMDPLEAGILRYRPDERLSRRGRFSGARERGRDRRQALVLRTKTEAINAGARYLEARRKLIEEFEAIAAFVARGKVRTGELALEEMEVEMKLQRTWQTAIHELELERRVFDRRCQEEDLARLKIKMEEARLLLGDRSNGGGGKENGKLGKIEEIIKIIDVVQDGKRKIVKKYQDDPERAESMLDLFERMLVEEGVIGDIE